MLPKYVFVRLGYAGWTGIDRDALQTKCRPFLAELRENGKRLKVSHKREGSGNGRDLKKERWTDGLACDSHTIRILLLDAAYQYYSHFYIHSI